MLTFPSEEWVAAYRDAVNANAAYALAAKDWTHGAVALVIRADSRIGLVADEALWLDLHQGVCRAARRCTIDEAMAAPFVISGEYARWKQVIRKELEPIKGMLQGKLKLQKGHMPTVVRFVKASQELVESTALVPTRFLGE